MKVGVLGGTRGVGRALVDALPETDHAVMVLVRDPTLFEVTAEGLTVEGATL